jgi:hypothetical protein
MNLTMMQAGFRQLYSTGAPSEAGRSRSSGSRMNNSSTRMSGAKESHNKSVTNSSTPRVLTAVRVRPMMRDEEAAGCKCVVRMAGRTTTLVDPAAFEAASQVRRNITLSM